MLSLVLVSDPDDCAGNNNCLHGGKCIDGPFSYTCQCVGNYAGPHCEGNVDLSENQILSEKGNCLLLVNLLQVTLPITVLCVYPAE